MKKTISNVCAMSIIAILFITAAILFTACKKECACAPLEPDAIEQVTFKLVEKTLTSEVGILKFNVNENYRENAQPRKPDEKLFRFFKEYCISQNIPVGDQAMAFVLYYDSPVSQSLVVKDEHIKGISLYNVEGMKIIHHLFIRNEKSDFYEVENVKVAVSGVSPNHTDFYLENYVFPGLQSKNNRSDIVLMGDFAVEIWKNIGKYKTRIQYEVNTTIGDAKALPPPGPGGRHCSNNERCPYGTENSCIVGPGGGRCGDLCVAEEMQGAILKDHVERMLIDLDLMHAFRDDFLYRSEKGEAYIDNYYYLSEEYDGKTGLALAIKSALVLKDFNPVMRAFVNPEEHLKDILFTDDLSTSLLSLLDEYEKITSSSEGKAILASIRKDVHSFKNKQLQEILAMIK